MINFAKKWSAPVVFAVLLHMIIVFIFYINLPKKAVYEDSRSQEISTEHFISSTTPTLVKTQASISTIDDPNTALDLYKQQQLYKDFSGQSTLKATETSLEDDTAMTQSVTLDFMKTNTMSTQKQQLNDKETDLEQNLILSANGNNRDNLGKLKKDSGLLSTDKPKQQPLTNIDENHEGLKNEVEEINTELSHAISEIKKRNQQKIDERQQQNDSIYILNSESSASTSQDDK